MLHKIYILNQNLKSNLKEYNFHKIYKDLLNICSQDLSAIYFDIRKDTLYCDEKESKIRKACINFLNILLETLLIWFAPILSFTTEEIYKIINKKETDSIHLKNFPNIPKSWKNDQLFKKWDKLNNVRQVCNAAIEVKRSNKELGSSLEADLEIYLDDLYLEIVKEINLSEYCITSHATAKPFDEKKENLFQIENKPGIRVLVKKAQGKKCPRCWKITTKKCDKKTCAM